MNFSGSVFAFLALTETHDAHAQPAMMATWRSVLMRTASKIARKSGTFPAKLNEVVVL